MLSPLKKKPSFSASSAISLTSTPAHFAQQPPAPVDRHPIFNRVLAGELVELLEEYHSGFLNRHDDKLWGGSPPGRGGYSSSLLNAATAQQVDQVLMRMDLMYPSPRAADEPIAGWWRHALEIALGWRNDGEYGHYVPSPHQEPPFEFVLYPTPTHAEMLEAATVFAIRLFKEVFPYGEASETAPQAA